MMHDATASCTGVSERYLPVQPALPRPLRQLQRPDLQCTMNSVMPTVPCLQYHAHSAIMQCECVYIMQCV
jgi:hypothetical protein